MPDDAELWAQHEKELARLEMAAKLPSSMDHRRQPRVRLRDGRAGQFVILGTRRTKRAAFRAARELRDRHGEKRPQVVWQARPHVWHFGVRRERPADGGDAA